MAYRKKRYNRRYKNKTKNFNKYAYAKTDSRNQAKQIVKLNKKITNVYKTLKSDLEYTRKIEIFNFGQEQVEGGTAKSAVIVPTTGEINQKLVFLNLRFLFNSIASDKTVGQIFRIFAIQQRLPGATQLPDYKTILENTDNISYNIASSFKRNITNKYKILFDKIINIPDYKDVLVRKYNFKRLLSYKKVNEEYRGQIYFYIFVPSYVNYSVSLFYNLGSVSDNV